MALLVVLLAALVGVPSTASALCAVEGKLELVRLNLDEPPAFVVHIRQPRLAVANAFHLERSAGGGLGEIPTLIQLLGLAHPTSSTVLVVGDLASCPDAAEIEAARNEGKGAYSGKLLRIFVKYR